MHPLSLILAAGTMLTAALTNSVIQTEPETTAITTTTESVCVKVCPEASSTPGFAPTATSSLTRVSYSAACPSACEKTPARLSPPTAPAAPAPAIVPTAPAAPFNIQRVNSGEPRVIYSAPAAPGASSETVQTIHVTGDGETIKLKIVGDKITGHLNGKPLEAHQIARSESGQIVITNTHGEPVRVLDMSQDGLSVAGNVNLAFGQSQDARGRGVARAMSPRAPELPDLPGGTPVRIGITFADPGQALAEQLGISPGQAVVVTGLSKNFPAALAGVKPNDVIVRIGDSKDGSEGAIRKALAGKRPGDEIKLKVLRRGEPKTFMLQLVGPDGEKSAKVSKWIEKGDGDDFEFEVKVDTRDEIEAALADAERALSEAMENGQFRGELEAARRGLAIAREQALANADKFAQLRRFPGNADEDALALYLDNTRNRPLVWQGRGDNNDWEEQVHELLHDHFEEQSEHFEDRMDRLSDRLDSLNDRLDDLVEAIEDLADAID